MLCVCHVFGKSTKMASIANDQYWMIFDNPGFASNIFKCKLKYNFVETPRKFILVLVLVYFGLYFYLKITMQTYKELIFKCSTLLLKCNPLNFHQDDTDKIQYLTTAQKSILKQVELKESCPFWQTFVRLCKLYLLPTLLTSIREPIVYQTVRYYCVVVVRRSTRREEKRWEDRFGSSSLVLHKS